MTNSVRSRIAADTFEQLKPQARSLLNRLNELHFSEAYEVVSELRKTLVTASMRVTDTDELGLNELYVLGCYVEFFRKYANFWEKIVNQHFVESWVALQDAFDLIRLIKRFSQIDFLIFENQLVELESAFPYNVFFSMGASVGSFECSICKQKMDSFECPHMRGQLYGGKMAAAVAKEITRLDHVAIVKHPVDKRCVIDYKNADPQFGVVRYLAELIVSRKLQISDFGRLRHSKRIQPNPGFVKLGRNELCICGSGIKFKKCCASKTHIEGDHIDIIGEPGYLKLAII